MLFRLEAVLDNGLEYERLLYGGMVGAKSSLGGCVEVEGSSSGGESSVDSGHEHFREGRGDGDATIVFRMFRVSFPFVQGNYLGCSPRCRRGLVDCTGI